MVSVLTFRLCEMILHLFMAVFVVTFPYLMWRMVILQSLAATLSISIMRRLGLFNLTLIALTKELVSPTLGVLTLACFVRVMFLLDICSLTLVVLLLERITLAHPVALACRLTSLLVERARAMLTPMACCMLSTSGSVHGDATHSSIGRSCLIRL